MAGLIQRAVNALYVSDTDTSRVRDNLVTALNPVLTFLTNNFAQDNPVLTFLRSVYGSSATFTGAVNTGPLNATTLNTAGVSTLVGDVNVQGNFTVNTRTGNGVVIVPAGGSPAFYITNPAGNQALFIVYADGTFVCQGATSANGFKTAIDIGAVWNTSATAGSYYGTSKVVMNSANNSFGSTPFYFKFPFPGSIVGWSMNNAGPDLGTLGLRYYRNGTQIANPLTSSGGGNNATFWNTHPKGQYPFAAGDTLTVTLGCSNAGNFQASAQLTLEMSA